MFVDHHGLMRVSQMCQFVEHLERQLYNAYEGAASALPSPPKVSANVCVWYLVFKENVIVIIATLSPMKLWLELPLFSENV